jgi:hypothetical protein
MRYPLLINFTAAEEAMIAYGIDTLSMAFYDTELFEELIKADLPDRFRAMSLDGAAALGDRAFESQEMLVHVLEEELLHLMQKAEGYFEKVDRRKPFELELDVSDTRKSPCPDS